MNKSFDGTLNALCLFLLFALGACLFTRAIETEDIWWHLKVGEFISTQKQVPKLDPFTFEEEKTPWILTQWLGSYFYYQLYHFTGFQGLIFFRALYFLFLIALLLRHMHHRIPLAFSLLILFPLMFAFETRALLRPFIFNFLFIQIFLMVLLKNYRSLKFSKLTPLLFFGWIWINTHLGAFMYGLLLLGLFLFFTVLDIIQNKSETFPAHENRERTCLYARHLASICVGYVLLFWVTPYGHDGAMHPWRTLLVPDYLSFGKLNTSIAELLPPQELFSLPYFWFFIFFLLGASSIILDKSRRFLKTTLFLLSLSMFLYARRGNIFFCLVSLNIFMDTAVRFKFLEKWASFRYQKYADPAFKLLFIFLCLVSLRFVAPASFYLDGRHETKWTHTFDRHNLRHMIRFMKENKIQGPLFSDDRYGGYLIFYAYPQIRPFVDSRQLNYNFYDAYHTVRRNPEESWPQLYAIFPFNAALLDVSKAVNSSMVHYFKNNPEWKIVQIIRSQILFVRVDAFANNKNLLAYEARLQNNFLLPRNLQKHKKRIVQYNERVDTAMTLFDLGFKKAALNQMEAAFEAGTSSTQEVIYRRMKQQYRLVK